MIHEKRDVMRIVMALTLTVNWFTSKMTSVFKVSTTSQINKENLQYGSLADLHCHSYAAAHSF